MTDIDFLLKALELKDESRSGWNLRGVENPESVAGHTWGVAFLAFLYAEDAGVDRQEAVETALVHDIHESVSGDIISGDLSEEERREKKEKEEDGFYHLIDLAGGGLEEVEERWKEYEKRDTRTSRFVKDMDLLDFVLQAYFYNRRERHSGEVTFFQRRSDMEELFEDFRSRLHTETGREVLDSIVEHHEEAGK
ncbi:MAG: HD family hydrolase [Candidatus Nanohaloarchaea archaeon]